MATSVASVAATQARRRQNPRILRGLFYVGVILIVLFCIAPLLWVFDESLKPASDLLQSPPTFLPSHLTLEGFTNALAKPTFINNIKNSVVIAGISTIVALLVGCSAGYAIARLRFRGRPTVLSTILAVTMFPQIAVLGPLYLFFFQHGWLDSYQALIIPNIVFTLPLTIWILTTFFRELPQELEESAKIDGAGILRTFFSVVLPLAAPGVFTAAILAFINAWNEYLFAVSFTTRGDVQPVTVGLTNFANSDSNPFGTPWGDVSAGAMIVTVPLILLVLVLQRRIVAGLTAGAVKG